MDRLGVRWEENNGYDRNVEEIIPALNRNTAGTVIIDEDSDKSAKSVQEGEEENEKRLYYDGSCIDDGYVGTGLIWTAQEYERNWEVFNGENYQLGDDNEVYDAEMFGIAMAIRHAAQRFGTDTQKITVFTDSQAALHRIKNGKEGPGQAFTRVVYRWKRDFLKKNPTIETIYRWYRASGVPRNEAADHWAKQGAMVQATSESLKCV
jgi:ribonuclease HI